MNAPLTPGSIIGVLGSGQLGRMFTIAARRLGYRVHTLSPDDDTPTGQVADVEIKADYRDEEAVAKFAKNVDVVTFEFENVPRETVTVVEQHAPVRPGGEVLHQTQNRFREKSALQRLGLATTPFARVQSIDEVRQAVDQYGPHAVLKTCAWGYDGKGQARIQAVEDIEQAWTALKTTDAVYEQFVNFQGELSVVAARSIDGSFVAYQPFSNVHRNHILDVTVCPARLPVRIAEEAIEMTRTLFEAFQVVGVMCVEFFLTDDDRLLINEIAPRPHNSGHLTIDAHITCQFEQQVRAVCGLPLGSAEQLKPAAMVNLLGDLWFPDEPRWERACAFPRVKLHLYGKREARIGRKMGHLTALGESVDEAFTTAQEARDQLTEKLAQSSSETH